MHTALACCVSYEVTDGIRTHSPGEFQGGKREHAPRRGHFWARGQCGVQRVQFGLSSLVRLFLAEEDPQVGRAGAGSTAWPRKGQHVHRFGVGLPRQDGGQSVVGGWLLKAQASLCVGMGLSEDLWAGSCSENKAPPWAQGLSIGSDPEGRGFPWLFV